MKECNHKDIRSILNHTNKMIIAMGFGLEKQDKLLAEIKKIANICLKQKEDSETFHHTFARVFNDMHMFYAYNIGGNFPFNLDDYNC